MTGQRLLGRKVYLCEPVRLAAGLLRCLGLFLGAGAGQDARERVVALVAGIFVNQLVDAVEWQFATERRGERRWVLHRELVQQDVRTGSSEPLGDLELVGRSAIRPQR